MNSGAPRHAVYCRCRSWSNSPAGHLTAAGCWQRSRWRRPAQLELQAPPRRRPLAGDRTAYLRARSVLVPKGNRPWTLGGGRHPHGWIDGITFRELKRSGDRDAIAQAGFAAGGVLAATGTFVFPRPGWIGPGPSVGSPLLEGNDPMPRFVDLCLASANLQRRMPSDLRDRLHSAVWSWAN